MCRHCRRLAKAVVAVVLEKPDRKPELYLGKKELCGYCEEMNHVYSTKKSHSKVCNECKKWLEQLPFLTLI
jgi:hypothetical protein